MSLKKALTIISLVVVVYGGTNMSVAKTNCLGNTEHPHEALGCYLREPESSAWQLVSTEEDEQHQVTIYHYELTSIVWPKNVLPWQHQLLIYRPKQIESSQALLFIGKGTNKPAASWVSTQQQPFNLVSIAEKSHTVVAELTNIPNQCITFADGACYQGDGLVAKTWLRYLQNPQDPDAQPAHFMMVKCTIIAMNAMQAIMAEQDVQLDKFALAGKSKRGWAAWLAALHDERINAIIPVVADFLDTEASIEHIKDVYHGYPLAMTPFVKSGVTDYKGTPQYTNLMQMQDPLSYLNETNFKTRLNIPKFIISSSGDDFTVPDTVTRYYDKIPGHNSLHMIPNNPHFVDDQATSELIKSYYQWLVTGEDLPRLEWQFDVDEASLTLTANQQPLSITLWQADNSQTQDFRYSSNVRYKKTQLESINGKISLVRPIQGWSSVFVSMQFKNAHGEMIELTTPGFILAAH